MKCISHNKWKNPFPLFLKKKTWSHPNYIYVRDYFYEEQMKNTTGKKVLELVLESLIDVDPIFLNILVKFMRQPLLIYNE